MSQHGDTEPRRTAKTRVTGISPWAAQAALRGLRVDFALGGAENAMTVNTSILVIAGLHFPSLRSQRVGRVAANKVDARGPCLRVELLNQSAMPLLLLVWFIRRAFVLARSCFSRS